MDAPWPRLAYADWRKTYETLHRWTQIVGKVRVRNEPWTNHSWSSTLYVTSRGLSTLAIPNGALNFSIEFDFIAHRLVVQSSDGDEQVLDLKTVNVSEFYFWLMDVLDEWGIDTQFSPKPNELIDDTAFSVDKEHHTYDPKHARTLFQVLVSAQNVFKNFRCGFEGKTSPIHFFWGSFDLAVTRFSGRTAPQHPGGIPHLPDRVTRDAYSHEVSSCGFWPGNEAFPHAAFYSYAYPEPEGFSKAQIAPSGAIYHPELREFLLPYDYVRNSSAPEQMILEFLDSTFRAASDLGNWDRAVLEVSPFFQQCRSNLNLRSTSL
jgi:hypothetical protein